MIGVRLKFSILYIRSITRLGFHDYIEKSCEFSNINHLDVIFTNISNLMHIYISITVIIYLQSTYLITIILLPLKVFKKRLIKNIINKPFLATWLCTLTLKKIHLFLRKLFLLLLTLKLLYTFNLLIFENCFKSLLWL